MQVIDYKYFAGAWRAEYFASLCKQKAYSVMLSHRADGNPLKPRDGYLRGFRGSSAQLPKQPSDNAHTGFNNKRPEEAGEESRLEKCQAVGAFTRQTFPKITVAIYGANRVSGVAHWSSPPGQGDPDPCAT
jgi:hypothetical protein